MMNLAVSRESPTWPVAPGLSRAPAQRVLVADRNLLFRAALCWGIFKARSDLIVEDVDHLAGLRSRLTHGPDISLILLDAALLEGQSDALFDIVGRIPVIIMFGGDDEDAGLDRQPLYGARDQISKALPLPDILAAITPRLRPTGLKVVPTARDDGEAWPLTPAQSRILASAATGLLNKQIAYEMGITETTVKAHMSAIFRKLGVQNRTQAINRAQQSGMANLAYR